MINKIKVYTIIPLLVTVFSHLYQYCFEDNDLGSLVRGLFLLLYALITFFFERKTYCKLMLVYCFIVQYFGDVNNIAPFIVILVIITYYNWSKLFLLGYAASYYISCIINGFSLSEYALHISICAWVYILIYSLIAKLVSHEKTLEENMLKLTKPELKILKELASGKTVKEIDIYSSSTIYTYLQNACKRNNCINSNELLFRFKLNIQNYS